MKICYARWLYGLASNLLNQLCDEDISLDVKFLLRSSIIAGRAFDIMYHTIRLSLTRPKFNIRHGQT